MDVRDLPAVNATLNGISTLLLIAGWITVRRNMWRTHGWLLTAALGTSAAFLSCYLYYHFHAGHTRFQGPPLAKTIYFLILIPHILLAVIMVPFIIQAVFFAVRRQWARHSRITRWLMPVWLYVSVTGVLVYMMLYQWFPSAAQGMP